MASNLRQASEALKKDSDFLTAGGVFTQDQIDAYIDLKSEEVTYVDQCPNPAEFKLYYSS